MFKAGSLFVIKGNQLLDPNFVVGTSMTILLPYVLIGQQKQHRMIFKIYTHSFVITVTAFDLNQINVYSIFDLILRLYIHKYLLTCQIQ